VNIDRKAFLAASLPWTYLVTDRGLCRGRTLLSTVESALRGGVNVVQYREKEAGTRWMVEEAGAMAEICRRYGALFVVNDRVDVALAVRAQAVHLGQEDPPPELARKILGPGVIIGVSASSVTEALEAESRGADYIGAGAVFATPTKVEAPALGIAGLAQICRSVSLPVVGIGGLHAGNADAVMASGASGVTVVSAIVAAGDPEGAARELAEKVNRPTAGGGR